MYTEAAQSLASSLVENSCDLVYGGGSVGLMGIVADAVMAAGGEVIGVIPRHLQALEVGHGGITELRVVETMLERKTLMADLADAFVALPGGYGTLDELFEMVTWCQLGLQAKPCGVLNVAGYYDRLFEFLDGCVAEHFIDPANRTLLISDQEPQALIKRLFARPQSECYEVDSGS